MSNPMRQHGFSNVLAVMALAAAGLAFARAEANRAQPLAPAVVATVDIERIFRDVDAGEAVDAALLATAQPTRDKMATIKRDAPWQVVSLTMGMEQSRICARDLCGSRRQLTWTVTGALAMKIA